MGRIESAAEQLPTPGARFGPRVRLTLPLAALAAAAGWRETALAAPERVVSGQAPSPVLRTVGPFPTGALVALQGTPHLWVADERGALHWGGDTRALQGKAVRGDLRTEVNLDRLKTLPRGEPWLSAGLVKIGDPIYLAKWETTESQPRLLHVQDIKDVELFGINATNYGTFVREREAWERTYGFRADALPRGVLPSAASLGATPGADQWRLVRSRESGFFVHIPNDARVDTLDLAGTDVPMPGVIEARLYIFDTVRNNRRLYLSVGTYLFSETAAREAAESLNQAMQDLASEQEGVRVVAQRPVLLGRHTGTEVCLELSGGALGSTSASDPSALTIRIFHAEPRFYFVYGFYAPEEVSMADAARFVDSFALSPA